MYLTRIIVIVSFVIAHCLCIAQQVFNPEMWVQPDIKDDIYCEDGINGYAAWCIDALDQVSITDVDLRQPCYFIVYASTTSSDLGELKTRKASFKMKDQRLSLPDVSVPTFVFTQSFAESDPVPPAESGIALNYDHTQETEAFEGKLMEVIALKRSINDTMRRSVETYLSIKYGISLDSDSTYIDPSGEFVFVAPSKFESRTTALARSDFFDLWHNSSTNSDPTSLLTLSCPKEQMTEQSYLFWSDDDGKPTMLALDEQLFVLDRKWVSTAVAWPGEVKSFTAEVKAASIEHYQAGLQSYIVTSSFPLTEDNLSVATWHPLVLSNEGGMLQGDIVLDQQIMYFTMVQTAVPVSPPSVSYSINCATDGPRLVFSDTDVMGDAFSVEVLADKFQDLEPVYNGTGVYYTLPNDQAQVSVLIKEESEVLGQLAIDVSHCLDKSVVLYPNPVLTDQDVIVELSNTVDATTVTVTDVFGRVMPVDFKTKQGGPMIFRLSAPGTYHLLLDDGAIPIRKRFIVIR